MAKLDEVLIKLKEKLSEKEMRKMEGMTLKELLDSAELFKAVKDQNGILEGIESLLLGLGKLDKLDEVIKAVRGLNLVVNVPDRVTVRNIKDAPKPIIPRDFTIANVEKLKDGLATDEMVAKLYSVIKNSKFSLPSKASDAIPVRLSDGKKFIDSMEKMADGQQKMVKVLGGGTSGQVFQTSGGSETKPTTAQSGGVEYVAVVNPDGSLVASDVTVTAEVDTTGLATETKQDTIIGRLGEVQASPTSNTVLDRLKGIKTSIDSIISGSEAQVDLVGAIPAGSNTIGSVKLTDGSEELGINAQGAIKVEGDSSGVAVYVQPGGGAVFSTISADRTDAIYNSSVSITPKFAAISASSSGDNTLVAAVAGKKIRVLAMHFVCASAVDVRLEDGAGGTALTGVASYAANSGLVLPYCPVGHFETSSNTLLNMELGGAVQVSGSLTYIEV